MVKITASKIFHGIGRKKKTWGYRPNSKSMYDESNNVSQNQRPHPITRYPSESSRCRCKRWERGAIQNPYQIPRSAESPRIATDDPDERDASVRVRIIVKTSIT